MFLGGGEWTCQGIRHLFRVTLDKSLQTIVIIFILRIIHPLLTCHSQCRISTVPYEMKILRSFADSQIRRWEPFISHRMRWRICKDWREGPFSNPTESELSRCTSYFIVSHRFSCPVACFVATGSYYRFPMRIRAQSSFFTRRRDIHHYATIKPPRSWRK